MSQDQSGEKTEKATPKRLRQARKRGQVAVSRDLTQTLTTAAWLLMTLTLTGLLGHYILEFTDACWRLTQDISKAHLEQVGLRGARLVVTLTLVPFATAATIGALSDFFQSGPVFSATPITPNLQHIDPVQGIKRLFGLQNWLELIKNIIKTVLILTVTVFLFMRFLPDLLNTLHGDATVYMDVSHRLLQTLMIWVCVVLAVFAILDWYLQKFLFQRNLRMSKQEVRDERKGEYGDPQLRSQRKRLQRQWAGSSVQTAVKNASALVVNPIHIAVALEYDPETTVVPLVTAMGEGNLAKNMRQLAEDEGVPVMRNIPLARRLYYLCEDEEMVPEELFDAVAEVLAWAENTRKR